MIIRSLFLLFAVSCSASAADPAIAITKSIDRELQADWSTRQIQPAPQADDLAFLRRASLDLLGRIPTLAEIKAFRNDPKPDKRAKALDRMLASAEFASHLANVTRVEWMPQTVGNFRLQFQGAEFEGWLEEQFAKNRPFDQTVKAILTAEANVGQRGNIDFGGRENGPRTALAAFYQVADGKPEEMAAASSRLFLGMKLECAQCHDHPFAPYSREQFWEFAAFFGEFTPLSPVGPRFVGPLPPQYESNRITIPNTTREVTARLFADNHEPEWTTEKSPRQELADWLTKPGNRLFARNVANRLWASLLGIGLTDPIDEPGDHNKPSHPQLLEALTDAVIANEYDIKIVLKGIAMSQAYQVSSQLTHPSQADTRRFARFQTRGLNGHQIFDSLNTSAGKKLNEETKQNRRFAASEVQGGSRGEFVARFPQSNRRTEAATSILQSLQMMNGPFVDSLTKKNATLDQLLGDKQSTRQRLEALFLATLCRLPTTDESQTLEEFVDLGGPNEDSQQAFRDVYWVLVNSSEFLLNH